MSQYMELKLSETNSYILGSFIGLIFFLFFISTFPLNFAKFINPEVKIVLLSVILLFISYNLIIDRDKRILYFFLILVFFIPSIFLKEQLNKDIIYFSIYLLLILFISKKNSSNIVFFQFKKTLIVLILSFALLVSISIILNIVLFIIFDFKYFNTIQGGHFGNYNIYTNMFGSIIIKKWNFGDYYFFPPRSFSFFIEPIHAAIFLASAYFYLENKKKNYKFKYIFLFASIFTFSGFALLFIFAKIFDFISNLNNFFKKKIKINISLVILIFFLIISFINQNLFIILDSFFSLEHRVTRITEHFPIFFDTFENVLFGIENKGKYGIISGLFSMILSYGLIASMVYFYSLKRIILDKNTFLFLIICSFFVQFQLFFLILPLFTDQSHDSNRS